MRSEALQPPAPPALTPPSEAHVTASEPQENAEGVSDKWPQSDSFGRPIYCILSVLRRILNYTALTKTIRMILFVVVVQRFGSRL